MDERLKLWRCGRFRNPLVREGEEKPLILRGVLFGRAADTQKSSILRGRPISQLSRTTCGSAAVAISERGQTSAAEEERKRERALHHRGGERLLQSPFLPEMGKTKRHRFETRYSTLIRNGVYKTIRCVSYSSIA